MTHEQMNGTHALRDATFVKGAPAETLSKLKAITDKRSKEEFLEKSARSLGTITNADPNSIRIQADAAAQKTLNEMFGEKLGTFLWQMRGGGQSGEDSPIWQLVNALERMDPCAPLRIESSPRSLHQTESTR